MNIKPGRLAILWELIGIEADLRRETQLVNALRMAIAKPQEGQREKGCHGETVFSR